jgi:hypothetical protein
VESPKGVTVKLRLSHTAAPKLPYSRYEVAYQLSISVWAPDYMIASKNTATQRIGRASSSPTRNS